MKQSWNLSMQFKQEAKTKEGKEEHTPTSDVGFSRATLKFL